MTMKPILLNRRLPGPREVIPCEPEVKVFDYADGTRVAFDVNSLALIRINENLAERIRNGSVPEIARRLGLRHPFAPVFDLRPTTPLRKLVLNVTHRCNLRCRYCSAWRDENPSEMSLSIAASALKMFTPEARLRIAFFGGEPLLAWPLIAEIAGRVRSLAAERNVPYNLHVTTNGTVITAMKARTLARFGFSVLLSLDGPEEIHNKSRPARDFNSFDTTMQGLDYLNHAGIRPTCRGTFMRPGTLVRRLVFFSSLQHRGKISGVSIEPAILSEGCDARIGDGHEEWHEAAKWYVRSIRSGQPLNLRYFPKLMRRILDAQAQPSECGAGRGYLTVGPDGRLYACHREACTQIGWLRDGKPEFSLERLRWIENRVSANADCMRCWARYLCGGGCRQAKAELAGSLHKNLESLCDLKRTLLRETFWILAQLGPDVDRLFPRRLLVRERRHAASRV